MVRVRVCEMRDRCREGWSSDWRVRVCCSLVILLVVAHIVLMASERYDATIGPIVVGAVVPAAVGAAHGDARAGEHAPDAPHPVVGGCSAQQAVLPVLLLLLALGALVALRAAAPRGRRSPLAWHVRFPLPPPLAPARRRALLQVFLN
jgi:hypothetical protein